MTGFVAVSSDSRCVQYYAMRSLGNVFHVFGNGMEIEFLEPPCFCKWQQPLSCLLLSGLGSELPVNARVE